MGLGSSERYFQKPDDQGAMQSSEQWTRKQFGEASRKIFEKAKQETKEHEERVGKFNLTVLPGVFSPKYFPDGPWFAEVLPAIVGKGSLLEVGPGTGIISLSCVDAGARVTATDINPQAVKNTLLNAEKFGLDISVRIGDMYEAIGPAEKFDFIFWNHPFNRADEPVEDMLLRAGFDHQYESLRKYISEAHNHLAEGGTLLLGTGTMANQEEIAAIAAEYGYRMTLVKEVTLPIEVGGNVAMKDQIYRLDPIGDKE